MKTTNSHIVQRSILDGLSFALFTMVALSIIVNPSEEDLLNMKPISIIFLVSMLAGAFLSSVLNKFGFKTLGENLFEPSYMKAKSEAKPWYKSFWGWHLFTTIFVLFIVGLVKTKFSILFSTKNIG